jgi:hypothetical protein
MVQQANLCHFISGCAHSEIPLSLSNSWGIGLPVMLFSAVHLKKIDVEKKIDVNDVHSP